MTQRYIGMYVYVKKFKLKGFGTVEENLQGVDSPIPVRVKNCASKVSSEKKWTPKNTVENISHLKVQQISNNPIKIQQLGPVPKNYRFLNSPPSPKNAPLIPVSVNMASPPLGFAVNIIKNFTVVRVDATKILILVVHKCARSHRQTCNSYKLPKTFHCLWL